MNLAWFRFYEELNVFLPPEKRKVKFLYSFSGTPAIKDAIEAIGIPHSEVDLILVNGVSVGFSYKLKDGDEVSVYPEFESFDITKIHHLRSKPLRQSRFILDEHLGKLAKYLRLFGFDTFYRINLNDAQIISLSVSEKRIILTRDIGLLKNKQVTHGYWMRSQHQDEQLREVFAKFDLLNQVQPFTRCIECNGLLRPVSKENIIDRLLPDTSRYFNEFRICTGCYRIYWEGSHYERMKKYVDNIINNVI